MKRTNTALKLALALLALAFATHGVRRPTA